MLSPLQNCPCWPTSTTYICRLQKLTSKWNCSMNMYNNIIFTYIPFLVSYLSINKRHTRDACLCVGGNQAPPAPPAPQFVFLITLWPLGGSFSNLAGGSSSPGEFFFWICCSDISTNQRGHMTKNIFFLMGKLGRMITWKGFYLFTWNLKIHLFY